MFGKLNRLVFGRRYTKPRGLLLFNSVQEAVLVNSALAKQAFQVRLVAPPPEYRIGCDLAVEFDLLEQEGIQASLKQTDVLPQRIVSSRDMLLNVSSVCSFVEIGDYLMCRASNMKLTIDLKNHRIVNVSGGGCPDIPFVAGRLHGMQIEQAEDPINLGSSLCTYLLQISFDALKARISKP